MQITIEAATNLIESTLQQLGYPPEDAATIAEHLIDSELRGYGSAGLARVLSIADRLASTDSPLPQPGAAMVITKETPASARVDGNDVIGYVVARHATELAVAKAKAVGVSCVCANGFWYSGMLSYYAEMCTKENLVCTIASHCYAWVAPHGSSQAKFGTNPYCIGFPSIDGSSPVIWDIGTSKIIHAQAVLANRRGEELAPDVAYGPDGKPTINPAEALQGALAVWGGHRGSGLALMVQLLGVMAGAPALPPSLGDFGFVIMCVNPALFWDDMGAFKQEIAGYGEQIRNSKPLDDAEPVRMPFERSYEKRRKNRNAGMLEVDESIVEKLKTLAKMH